MSQSLPSHHEVRFPYAHGALSGVLITPPYLGRHPAVVLLPGSGSADRNTPYLLPIRDYLVNHGIAVLAFDKPGLGASSGDWRHQTFYDRVEQARSVMLFLQQREDIHAQQIGLYGISQGAWITLLAAASYPNIPFIIPVSGPAMRPVDQDVYYVEHVMRADGFSELEIQQALQYVERVLMAARDDAEYQDVATRLVHGVQHEPWYHYYPIPDADIWEYFRRNAKLDYDPVAWLAQVRCSVLAILGAADLLLPAETSAAVYRQALRKAGNQDVTIKVFARAGHLITVPPAEALAPGFLELVGAWLQQRTTNG